jgi:hypothetical protein
MPCCKPSEIAIALLASVLRRREIVREAKEYLAQHPELIEEAKPIVEHGAGRGSSANELRKAQYNLRHLSNSRKPAVQGIH